MGMQKLTFRNVGGAGHELVPSQWAVGRTLRGVLPTAHYPYILRTARVSEGDAHRVRVVHAQHRFLIEPVLVALADDVDLPAALAEVFEGKEENQHEGCFLDDLTLFAPELPVALQQREAIREIAA